LVPRGWVSSSKRRGHFGGEGGRRSKRIADGITGQRSCKDHENRLLKLSTVQPTLVMEFDIVAYDQRRRQNIRNWSLSHRADRERKERTDTAESHSECLSLRDGTKVSDWRKEEKD
jgi:hypothetical protein